MMKPPLLLGGKGGKEAREGGRGACSLAPRGEEEEAELRETGWAEE